jgi:SAM-dependent methyltransferase
MQDACAQHHVKPPRVSVHSGANSELAWFDHSDERRGWLDRFLYGPPAFDAVLKAGFDFLDARLGERVLDLGCGEGRETLKFSQIGLRVVGVDVSYNQLRRTQARLGSAPTPSLVNLVQADAAHLPFASGAFRFVYGKAILHHLDMALGMVEIRRVLQIGGRASFAEPLAQHPLLKFARLLTPPLRTHDEHPLTWDECERFAQTFSSWNLVPEYLLAPLAYPLRLASGGAGAFRWMHARLERIDKKLFRCGRGFEQLAWYGVINVSKSVDWVSPVRSGSRAHS